MQKSPATYWLTQSRKGYASHILFKVPEAQKPKQP